MRQLTYFFLRKFIFGIYNKIPLKPNDKIFIKKILFTYFSFVFKNTVTYRNWEMLKQNEKIASRLNQNKSETILVTINEVLSALKYELPFHINSTNFDFNSEIVIDVIIPIYKNKEITIKCINSVLETKNKTKYRVILVNDKSPDEELTNKLRKLKNKQVILIENKTNLGFVKSVNKGILISDKNHVILLNSDTLVSDGWIDKIYYHNMINKKIGTISPLSNNATICNFPTTLPFYQLPNNITLKEFDLSCEIANKRASINIPTSVGFCMFINRNCIKETGLFDEKKYGLGYGEENDFCNRSTSLGWNHILALDTFVFHVGEVSFDSNIERRNKAQKIINKLYPSYDLNLMKYFQKNEITKFRLRGLFKLLELSKNKIILVIAHVYGGGVKTYVDSSYTANEIVLVMTPVMNNRNLIKISAHDNNFKFDYNFYYENLEEIQNLIQVMSIDKIDLHHRLGYSFDVDNFVQKLQIKYTYYIHDYYSICPRLFLNRTKMGYCGEPNFNECNICLNENIHHQNDEIIFWRQKNYSVLTHANDIVAPSNDTKNRIQKYYPDLKIKVINHDKICSYNKSEIYFPEIKNNGVFRIALLGVLSHHKGKKTLERLIEFFETNKISIKFHLVGYPEGDIFHKGSIYSFTGPYDKTEEISLIKKYNPHLILFLSNVPETYSFTLSTALRLKLPVIAPNLGAFKERLMSRENTWLFENGIEVEKLSQLILEAKNKLINSKSTFSKTEYKEYEISPNIINNQLIKKVTNKKTVIGVLCEKNGFGYSACAYIRLIEPLRNLNAQNYILQYIDVNDIDFQLIDIIIIQRLVIKDHNIQAELINKCKKHNIKIIYEIDDLLIDLPKDHQEFGFFNQLKPIIFNWLSLSDQIWVSSPYLKQKLSSFNKSIYVFENFLSDYHIQKSFKLKKNNNNKIRILYFGGPGHMSDFELINEDFSKHLDYINKNIDFESIGFPKNFTKPYLKNIQLDPHIIGKYPNFLSAIAGRDQYDLGLIPLKENEFNYSKSYIKFLDYTNLGLVTVGSDISSLSNIINNRVNGILIDPKKNNWIEVIRDLKNNKDTLINLKKSAIDHSIVLNETNKSKSRDDCIKKLLMYGVS